MSNENSLQRSYDHFHFIVLQSALKGLEDAAEGRITDFETVHADMLVKTGDGQLVE